MVSSYRTWAADLDDRFDPYVEGAPAPLTGRRVLGVDLNRRYAPIRYGSKGQDVGYRVGGVDISNFFAAKGTAQYGPPDPDPQIDPTLPPR
ncbi:hypothetical protein QEG16_001028 [Stenotrophomonas maltophilia]|nr:hypothetical protein [Stenotrophomonas maltophilia]